MPKSKGKLRGVASRPRFRLCVHPCPRYITDEDTHDLCVVCLGAEHAESALEGADCHHCERLSLRTLRTRRALFEKGAFASSPRGAGPAAAEAERRLHSWGSQADLAGECETGMSLSPPVSARSGAPPLGWEADSSPRDEGSTLRLSSSKEDELTSVDEVSPPLAPQYEELLEVITRAVDKLDISWPPESTSEPQPSRLDERLLRSRPAPLHRSLPFFPDLHTEVSRSWARPFSARQFVPSSIYYGNVRGLNEHGYKAMPPVEQTLASYLSPSTASSLKAPVLPTKSLRTTSSLVGRGYAAAGQAGACLHTMSVLQAYQAELLRELDESGDVRGDDILELRKTADLAVLTLKAFPYAFSTQRLVPFREPWLHT